MLMTKNPYICTIFHACKMKRFGLLLLACLLCLSGCRQAEKNAVLLHRDFYNTVWERFDYVQDVIEVSSPTTYDLSLRISFTDEYPYNDISLIFTVFDENDDPYRAKAYKFALKDADGNWNSEKVDNAYTFVLPINKQLSILDSGKYRFRIEQKMPITPVVGVKALTLTNNQIKN